MLVVEVLGCGLAVDLRASVCSVAFALVFSVVPASKRDSRFHLLLAKYPIVLEIEVVSFSDKEVSEHGYQLLVVRLLLKLELATVVQELAHLTRVA